MLPGVSSFQKKAEEKPDAKQVQIEGEVVDLGCFTTRDARGEDHKACATRCIKNGNPAGIVVDNGKVYTIAAAAMPYANFASQRIRLTGLVKNSLIRPEKMAVREGKSWREVELKFGAPKED